MTPEDLRMIAEALGIHPEATASEIVAGVQALRAACDREREQHRQQVSWRARDQTELARILGLDSRDPKNTIPVLHDKVRRVVRNVRNSR